MWVLKFRGETFYVEHVDCNVKWSTKETPSNSHTKGSIKIKNCLLVINDDNCAIITELTEHDKTRLRNREKGITRIITKWGQKLQEVLKQSNIKHGPIKTLGGGCGSLFYVTDILKQSHMTMFMMLMSDTDLRVLKENEPYYKYYDDPNYVNDDDYWDYDDNDDNDED